MLGRALASDEQNGGCLTHGTYVKDGIMNE
jgi:hypothetical protein